jgi:phosphoserine phosphatase
MTAVVALDLDGTLLRGTSVSMYLAEAMCHGERLRDLESNYAAGTISNRDIAERTASWFTGLTPANVGSILEDAPWIDGVPETVAALRAHGIRVIIATVTWKFAADKVARTFGFEAASGTAMGLSAGRLTGRVAQHFDEFDKRNFVRRWCEERATSLDEVVAVGDSRSDLPLFSVVGRSIALNSTPAARATADESVDTHDLRDVLPALGEVLGQEPDSAHT